MEILGIDIGGSGIKGVPVNIETGAITMERCRIDTPKPSTIPDVSDVIQQIATHFNWTGKIGCTMPGIVQNGVIKMMGNFPEVWIDQNAETIFSEKTGLPVKIVNDADAAGLGELYFGKAAGKMGTVILLTFGTGVGSALIRDGNLVPNAELGHLRYAKNQIWEKYCADSIRKAQKLGWEAWSKRVNEYLAHLELLFSPDLFIIGGGAANKTDKYWHFLEAKAEIVPALLKNNAGIVGAAMATK